MVPDRATGGPAAPKTQGVEVGVGACLRQPRPPPGRLLTSRARVGWGGFRGISGAKAAFVAGSRAPGHQHGPQVVWLSDGARGLWRLYEKQLAAVAVGILDFYHAVQYLWKGAAAWLDGRTTRACRWFGWGRHRLRHGQPDGVLADLVEALAVQSLPDSTRDTLTALYAYLERHRGSYRLCEVQRPGLADGEWNGRECV